MHELSAAIGRRILLSIEREGGLRRCLVLLIVSLWLLPSSLAAQGGGAPPLQMGSDAEVHYDARSTSFDREGQRYLFDGDVVLIGGGYLITADSVDVEYFKKELTATGHVLFMYQNQIFTGDRIHLQWTSGDFKIENAVLVSNDPREASAAAQRVLGQSVEEINYEAARRTRLQGVTDQKAALREGFRLQAAEEPDEILVESYARLLEQQQLIQQSQVPSQAERDPERRKRFEERRKFWQQARSAVSTSSLAQNYYFRIEGDTIERTDGYLYRAKDASFTPCICDEDDTPAWGFQAESIEAMQEGYVDMKHPILKIKGVPVLYLPFLKMPLKAKRQSGFLMPQVQTGQPKNGFVYTQPVFFDLAPNADATLTTDIFQKRGTRVGLEARYVGRRYSGFRYQAEVIRDSSWLLEGAKREDLQRYFLLEEPYCVSEDPIEKAACEQTEIRERLAFPTNTQRGKQEWDGRYFLAPRLSLVTKGEIVSDHRYVEDLYLPTDVLTAFGNLSGATQYSTSKARVNFDGKDFFAGLGTSFGDGVRDPDRYAGQQLPASFNVQTRYFRLLPARWIALPIYAQLDAKAVSIQESQFTRRDPNRILDVTLGSGSWQRYALQLNTPLISDSIIRLDHFAEGEVRSIAPEGLGDERSSIRSWRTGFTINLPIDGIGRLPAFLDAGKGESYLHHIMNWSLGISLRPVVVRDGTYGELKTKQGAPLVYFPSDRLKIYQEDRDVADEDVMVEHKRLTLATSHRWRLFDRVREAVPAQVRPDLREQTLIDMKAEAKRELMTVKEKRVNNPGSMYQENGPGQIDWYIPRYRTVDSGLIEPLWLTSTISYDSEQEALRQEQLELNRLYELEAQQSTDPAAAAAVRAKKTVYTELAEPWIGPFTSIGVVWKGFSLSSAINYNLYERTSSSLSFALGLPAFYENSLGLGYVLEKSPELVPGTSSLLYRRTKTLNTGWTTTLIPRITLAANYITKQVESDKPQYGTSYRVSYNDPSNCWSLQLAREKDLNQEEKQANYIVQLAIIFLGKQLGGDLSPAIERDLGLKTSEELRSSQ